jgi:hypothetical protein
VVERPADMHQQQTGDGKADQLMHNEELLRERLVLLGQRRQVEQAKK